jgi:hypothetical protein
MHSERVVLLSGLLADMPIILYCSYCTTKNDGLEDKSAAEVLGPKLLRTAAFYPSVLILKLAQRYSEGSKSYLPSLTQHFPSSFNTKLK